MVFLAELGDKTQLVALCFASRFKARTVLAGVFAATLLVHVVSVLLGKGLGSIIPTEWISLVGGLAFIAFGLWTLRGDDLDDDSCNNKKGKSPFFIVATTFFLAELGDKTMLMTVDLATKLPMLYVWLGSTLGMVVSDGLAILVGKLLGKNLPERLVKIGAAIIFFGFGIYSGAEGLVKLPPYAWGASLGATLLMVGLFIRSIKSERSTLNSEKLEPAESEILV